MPAVVEVIEPTAAHAASSVDERHLAAPVLEPRLHSVPGEARLRARQAALVLKEPVAEGGLALRSAPVGRGEMGVGLLCGYHANA